MGPYFSSAVVLTGATASGKSAVALEIAERIGGEIVAMDSMTLYRGLDIGTAKPSADERRRVPHHLIDVLEPSESGNVAWWLSEASRAVAAIRQRGKRPILVGGTPFYLKAVLHGLFEGPTADPGLRAKLEALPKAELFEKLRNCDPQSAARLHPNDVRRVVRALEVFEQTGRPISELQTSWAMHAAPVPCAVLDWPRDELYARIDGRVRAMLDAGWLDECRRLQSIPLGREARQAVGYAELFEFLNGNSADFEQIVAAIQMRTRQLAKRQLTWFRSVAECVVVPATGEDPAAGVIAAWDLNPPKD
jgi:tRNA dimethylallyltransferase